MQRDAIDFESGDVATLFRKMLLPTLIGTLAMSAMTVIDGMIVGHGVGPEGVAAVNIIVPIYQIMSGIGLMIGAGCSVVASIHLSQRKFKVARLNITQAIIASMAIVTALVSVMFFMPETTARLLGASSTLMPHVLDYMIWLLPGFIFEMIGMIGLFVIRLDGSPRYAMWCNIIPAVLNALLDYIFVFPLGMGVKGAGVATAMCMALGGVMALVYMLMPSHELHLEMPKLSLKSLRLSLRNVAYQCRIGMSSLLGELSLAIVIFVGNIVFMRYLGDSGVSAFGISCYYTPFFFMVGNAIQQSAQPIISYNYGAKRWDSVARVRRLMYVTSLIIGVLVSLLFVFAPEPLVGLFVDVCSAAGQIAIEGFPYYAAGIIFFIFNIVTIGYYQSIERTRRAMLLVMLRGAVFIIPTFILMPELLGVVGIWLAMPLSELLTLLVALIFVRR